VSGPDPASLKPDEVVVEAEALLQLGLGACLGAGPVVLEIGFGRGELLIDLAGSDPGRRYLGVEVSRKRVQKVARRVVRAEVSNARLVHATAELLLDRVLPAASIDECWINFPDPWPKKRHFKRRLIRPPVLARLAEILRPGARLHIATDHPGYAEWIAAALDAAPEFENLAAPERWSTTPPKRSKTAYEAEFLADGRSIAYFEYQRRTSP
jgi:tRNA (guanine-N7-)-methyltransferase